MADIQEIRASSYVGFDSITRQIEHKLLKRGFQFNVIAVGALLVLFTFPLPHSLHACVCTSMRLNGLLELFYRVM